MNGFVSLLFVTVANNTGTGVSLGNGSLRNSLIVGNSTDCATFTYILSGVNMDTDSSCGGATRTLAQIELGALGDNGGVTETHALGDTSSAVNKAVDCTDFSGSISVTNDQIAQTRPGNSDCDLGSYENQTGGGGVGAAEAAEVPTEALPPTAESTLEVTAEVTPEVTVEVTLEVTPEPTPEVTSEVEITPEVTDIVVPPTIEVTLTPGQQVELEGLARALADSVPGAHLDDHKRWNAELAGFAASSEAVGWSVLLLIALATFAIVIFATQAGLQTHREIVEVVHMIGARDVFIASEFQRHFLWLGIRGGLIGLVIAAFTLIGSSFFWDGRESPVAAQYLPQLVSSPLYYLWLLFVPAAMGLIAMMTARFTVLRVLGRMP